MEINAEFIQVSAGLGMPLCIYNPELLSTLALLSVSQGLSACSPSAASSFCADQLLHQDKNQEPWPSNSRLGMNLTKPSSMMCRRTMGIKCMLSFESFYGVNSQCATYCFVALTWQVNEALHLLPHTHVYSTILTWGIVYLQRHIT